MNIKQIPSDQLAKLIEANQGSDLAREFSAELDRRNPKPKVTGRTPVAHAVESRAAAAPRERWVRPARPVIKRPRPYKPESTTTPADLEQGWIGWLLTIIAAFLAGYFWMPHK